MQNRQHEFLKGSIQGCDCPECRHEPEAFFLGILWTLAIEFIAAVLIILILLVARVLP